MTEKELDEMIDKMAAEIEKELYDIEKATEEFEIEVWDWEDEEKQMAEREKEMEEDDREMNQILRETLIDMNTPFCHYIKPDGITGKEFMTENTLLRHCVDCNDEGQCWSHGQLKDLIEEERKTLLNQDY